jgi:hypothetical protein
MTLGVKALARFNFFTGLDSQVSSFSRVAGENFKYFSPGPSIFLTSRGSRSGTDRTVGVGGDEAVAESELAAFEDQYPAQEGRTQAPQEAQDLKGLQGTDNSRQGAQHRRADRGASR